MMTQGPQGCSRREIKKFGLKVVVPDEGVRRPQDERIVCAQCGEQVGAPLFRRNPATGRYVPINPSWWQCPNGCNKGGRKAE